MDHGLEIVNGEAQMAYAASGGPCYHQMGYPVSDDLSTDEFLKAAHLDWSISKRPIYISKEQEGVPPTYSKVPKQFALTRDDNNTVLSIVGPDYVPLQNSEAFEFFRGFVDAGQMQMETAGSILDGRHTWAMAKINKSFELKGGDEIKSYLLLSSPNILGKSMVLKFTPLRVVCRNTLYMGLNDGNEKFRFLHLRNFDQAARISADKALGITSRLMDKFEDTAKFLASKRYDESSLNQFLMAIFDQKALDKFAEEDEFTMEYANRLTQTARRAVDESPGADMESALGTWWGALMGTTYTCDNAGYNNDAVLASNFFGTKATQKLKAMELAIDFARAS